MKRSSFKTLLVMSAALLGTALASCTPSTPVEEESVASTEKTSTAAAKTKIHMQLVPSNSTESLTNLAKTLGPILNKFEPNYDFTVDVGSGYAAVQASLEAGQIDVGFLPAGNYAASTIDHPGKVDVLLSAVRAGYKVQLDDFPTTNLSDKTAIEKWRKAMNGMVTPTGTNLEKADWGGEKAYQYRGQQSETKANFYSSVVISLNETARTAKKMQEIDDNHDGDISLKELHDHECVFGHMAAGSSSGYNYPTKWLYDSGYTLGFKTKDEYDKLSESDKALAVIGVDYGSGTGYPGQVNDLMEGKIDVACGFFDIRYGSAFVQKSSDWKGKEEVFTNTWTVAISDPVMNDTVSVRSGLSTADRAAVANALKSAVADGDKDTEGTGAYVLYQIYSHTGYADAKDSDYDPSREMAKWMRKMGF